MQIARYFCDDGWNIRVLPVWRINILLSQRLRTLYGNEMIFKTIFFFKIMLFLEHIIDVVTKAVMICGKDFYVEIVTYTVQYLNL